MLVILIPKDILAQTATQPLGNGTAEQPYRVSTLDNLYWITQNSTSWDKHFIQTADIDATSTSTWDAGAGFTPIGNTTGFSGIYNGQEYTIDGLFINRPTTGSVGLFGRTTTSSGKVENLGLTNVYITGDGYVGGLVGYVGGYSSIENCYTTGSVTGVDWVGGLVGMTINGSYNQCYSTADVTGEILTGGLVGHNNNGTITNCYTTGNVTRKAGAADVRFGAFVGNNYNASIENSYATGSVTYIDNGTATGKGFCGASGGTVTYENNFFDSQTSNQTTATGATAKTTAQMQNIDTYTDETTPGLTNAWDFFLKPNNDNRTDDIWGMNKDSYPHFLVGELQPEGDGSINTPYKIANLQNLYWLMQNTDEWDKYYEQTADIDAYATISWDNGAGFTPLGNFTNKFTGYYYGKNHTISNLYINRPTTDYVAFIGILSNAGTHVKDIGITDCDITGNEYTAGLIGRYEESSSFSAILKNCYTSGTITGNDDYTAGLIAYIYNDEIEVYNCYSNCDVTGTSYVAGLIAYYYGSSNQDNIISSSYSTGTITASNYPVGGLIGYMMRGEINNSYSKANVYKTTLGTAYLGAFVGRISYSIINYSYATGSVTISGSSTTNDGFVSGGTNSTFTDNFFDSEASNQTTAIGATAKNTFQMKTQSTFTNWDFSNETTNGTTGYWAIDATVNDGYPSLVNPAGSGTSSDPYIIATLSDLKWLSNNSGVWDKHFIQTADIDASSTNTWNGSYGFSPIGNSTTEFTGVYDGQEYAIDGLYSRYNDSQALFGRINAPSELKNIAVTNASIISLNGSYIGALVGNMEDGTVTNCYTTGEVTGRMYTGGLIGYISSGIVTKSYSEATVVVSYQHGGGLIGYISSGTISESYSTGDVSSGMYVGGFVGSTNSSGTIINSSYSTGNVSADGGYCGGFVGRTGSGIIRNSYSKGNVTRLAGGTTTYIAGFAGYVSGGTIEYSYSAGSLTWEDGTALTNNGFVGEDQSGTYTNNFFDSDVSTQTETASIATAQTTANMKIEATFTAASWDFMGETTNGTDDYWHISSANDGYPSFKTTKGEGTLENPYEIANLDDLYWLSQTTSVWSGKYFIQTADIDASETSSWDSGAGFSPIGNSTTNFSGYYNGQGFIIDGLFINRPSTSHIGLFGLARTIIKNLGITNCDITGLSYVGAFIGRYENSSTSNTIHFNNCYATGSIDSPYDTGGLIGWTTYVNIENCYSGIDITAGSNAGGLIGYMVHGSIKNSYNTGNISADNATGGLIGENWYAHLSNCYNTGSVTRNASQSGTNIGGLVGITRAGNYENCYVTGLVSVADGTALTTNGFIGFVDSGTPVYTNNFFNSTTTGQISATGATAKTTAEMQSPCMYIDANWDFMLETTNGTDNLWGMNASENNGFPFLSYQGYEHNNGCSPTTQATDLVFTEGTTSANISWTNGDGDSRVVFISESTTGEPTVVDNTTYTANTAYGSGTEAGTAWYCIYNGTSTSVTVTNLTAGSTYRVMALEYKNGVGSERYATQTGASNPENFTQNKENQTITFSALAAMTYGDADVTLTATASSTLAVEYSSSNTDVATIVSGQIHIVGAGTCNIYADQSGDAEYNAASQVPQSLTVNTKELTVTGVVVNEKVYNGNTWTGLDNTARVLNGVEAGDNVTLSATTSGQFDDKNVGTNKAVTATYTISGTDAANYSVTNPTLSGNVTQKALTINGVTASNKTYDATTDATISGGWLSGVESGDVVTLSSASATGSFDDKNIGTDKTVTTLGYTISGADADNYSLTQPSRTADITAKELTVTGAGVDNKVYDANTNATITGGTLSGVVASETVTLTSGTGTFTSVNVGTGINVTANYSISGTDAGNYSLTQPTGLSGNITQATLTATADNKSKTYGEANPALTFTYSGFVNSETSSVINTEPTAITTATTGSNAGNYAITVSGGSDNNYSFNYVSGTLTINKANQTITITAIDDKDVNVDPLTFNVTASTTSGLTLTYARQSGPATISGNTITLTGETGIVVVAVSQAGNTNYNAATTQTENFNVFDTSKDDQTITFNSLSNKTYGDADFNLTATASSGLTVSYTVASGPATISGNTVSITGAGNVTIEANQAGDDTYNPANAIQQSFTVNKASLTVTADNKSKTYGEANPALTFVYSGFVNSENSSVLDTEPTASTTAATGSDAGAYTITVSGGSDNNYSYSYVTGTLTVGKATLTVTADDKSKTYGDANPAFTFSYSGFINSETSTILDTEPTASTTADASSNVATYDITVSGGSDNNYSYSYVTGTLTVGKASLTATADNDSRTYGATNPSFTISYTGFVNSDTKVVLDTEPTASTTAGASSNIGTYAITLSGGSDNNYTFGTLNDGTLTVTKTTLTATAENKSKTYGEANPALTITYSGFVNDESSSVIDTEPTASTTATTGSDAGTYDITVSGGSDNNYSFTYVTGTLTINKIDQTITITAIDDKDIATDALTFDLTASTTSGLTLTYAIQSGPANISGTTITLDGTVGTVVVEVSQSGNDNYNAAITQTESFDVINSSKTDQTITFGTLADKTYDDDDFDLTATASSDLTVDYTLISGPVTISGSTVTITGTGNVTIEANQAGDDSYNPATAIQQSFTVNKADQTITITAISDKDINDNAFDIVANTTSGLSLTYSIQSGPATISGTTITLDGTTGTIVVEISQVGNDNYNSATETSSFNVTNTTSIADITNTKISIYPNPTVDRVKIDFTGKQIEKIRLIDYSGKIILLKTNVKDVLDIDLSGYVKGTYFIQIQSENTIITKKVVKL